MMMAGAPGRCEQVADSSMGVEWGVHDVAVAAEGYRKITLRLSEDALEGWEACAAEAAVSLSALTEAVGLFLRDGRFTSPQGHLIIETARKIDLERRRRRPVE